MRACACVCAGTCSNTCSVRDADTAMTVQQQSRQMEQDFGHILFANILYFNACASRNLAEFDFKNSSSKNKQTKT